MGIPSFFRWLATKYPRIVVDAIEEFPLVVDGISYPVNTALPCPNGEYDNLYLDMNGIIHPACHPEGRPQPKNEDEMIQNIFEYIDRVFALVRPRRLLYMAIDGVAPRAKMNQQRARRFRAAREAQEKEDKVKALKKEFGITAPTHGSWDSNVITPGTPFMARVSDSLHYYIRDRVSNDEGWRGVQVLFSDASVPGEGEHKLMAFIRSQRAQPSHDPNTRHCLYGMDADLIMLGMASHEPHFSIIREQVVDKRALNKPVPCFTCNKVGHTAATCPQLPQFRDLDALAKAHEALEEDDADEPEPPKPQDAGTLRPFQFLHLNILRDYLAIEFEPLRHLLAPEIKPVGVSQAPTAESKGKPQKQAQGSKRAGDKSGDTDNQGKGKKKNENGTQGQHQNKKQKQGGKSQSDSQKQSSIQNQTQNNSENQAKNNKNNKKQSEKQAQKKGQKHLEKEKTQEQEQTQTDNQTQDQSQESQKPPTQQNLQASTRSKRKRGKNKNKPKGGHTREDDEVQVLGDSDVTEVPAPPLSIGEEGEVEVVGESHEVMEVDPPQSPPPPPPPPPSPMPPASPLSQEDKNEDAEEAAEGPEAGEIGKAELHSSWIQTSDATNQKGSFAWNLEQFIDDFVFICFFVGNDFLPHLPSLEISEGATDTLLTIYKRLLPSLGGYLCDRFNINFSRVDILLAELGQLEDEAFKHRMKRSRRYKFGRGGHRGHRGQGAHRGGNWRGGDKSERGGNWRGGDRSERGSRGRGRGRGRDSQDTQNEQKEDLAQPQVAPPDSTGTTDVPQENEVDQKRRRINGRKTKQSIQPRKVAAPEDTVAAAPVVPPTVNDSDAVLLQLLQARGIAIPQPRSDSQAAPLGSPKSSDISAQSADPAGTSSTDPGEVDGNNHRGKKRKSRPSRVHNPFELLAEKSETEAEAESAQENIPSKPTEKNSDNDKSTEAAEGKDETASDHAENDEVEEKNMESQSAEVERGRGRGANRGGRGRGGRGRFEMTYEDRLEQVNLEVQMGVGVIRKHLDEEPIDHVRLGEVGWKERYYQYKLDDLSPTKPSQFDAIKRAYTQGLSWVMHYYYDGCPSWGWYFPYHYAPMASDLINVDCCDTKFFSGKTGDPPKEDSDPLLPLEQLLAVLPPKSAHCLPPTYKALMVDEDSPIKALYPDLKSIGMDLNGKRWPSSSTKCF